MINNSTKNLVNKYTNKYSKEEFEFLISLFPHVKVTEIIRQNEKNFREYYKGFRPDKLPLKKLQEIYYKGIYNARNLLLAKQTESMKIDYIKKMDEVITNTIDPIDVVRNKIKQDDMSCFEQLINLLLEYKYDSVEKILVYFKMIEHELSESQKSYIIDDFEKVLFVKNLTKDITQNMNATFDIQMNELKEKYENVIRTNESKIDELLRLQKSSDKKYHELLKQKEKEAHELAAEYKHSLEILVADNEKYSKRVSELENEINDLINVKVDYEEMIKNLTSVVNMKYDEYCATAEEKWIESNDELVQNKKEIQQSIDELFLMKDNLTCEIDTLERHKTELENTISFLDDKGKGVVHNIRDLLTKIGYKNEVSSPESRLSIRTSKSNVIEEEFTNDKSYFIDDLAINLNICGIRDEYTNDLSKYIYAAIARKLSLLLVGYNSRRIADALSYLIGGSTSEIITLPPGYDNCKELMSTVQNSTNKVILIENAIDNTPESVYLPLLKNEMDRILLFSLDSSEHINLLPKSLMDYMMIIDIDSIMGLLNSTEEMIQTITYSSIFNGEIQEEKLRNNYNLIRKLNHIYPISQVAKYKFAEVMSVIDEQNSSNALFDIIMFSMKLMCNSIGKSQELKDYVDQNKFSPTISKMLHEAIEEGMSNG